MTFRWLNSFTILAAILIAIGVIGGTSDGRMVFDPGREATGREWVLYLLAGILMLVNGLLPPATLRDEVRDASDDEEEEDALPAPVVAAAGPLPDTRPQQQTVAVADADPDR